MMVNPSNWPEKNFEAKDAEGNVVRVGRVFLHPEVFDNPPEEALRDLKYALSKYPEVVSWNWV